MNELNPMNDTVAGAEFVASPLKSAGEKLFDRIVYAGFAGIGAFVTTVPLAFLIRYGRWKSCYERSLILVEEQASRLFLPEVSRKLADESVMTTALMMGGNVMLVPIWAAEHYKPQIVSGLNRMLGDNTQPQAPDMTARQTLWSLVEGRALAWTTVFASFAVLGRVFKETINTFEIETGNLLCKITRRPTTRMVETIEGGMRKTVPMETRTFIYGKIGALDIFATAAAATLLYVSGHFFARRQEEKKKERQHRQPAHHATSAQSAVAAAPETTSTAAEHLSSVSPQIQGRKIPDGMVVAAAPLIRQE